MKMMCGICKIVRIIVTIGAINWGLIALFNYDLVGNLLGEGTLASRIAYGIVGLAGLMLLFSFFKVCPACANKKVGG